MQLPQIQTTDTDGGSNRNRRSSGGSVLRGWWSPSSGRRRESLTSSSSEPKSPAFESGEEMGRIEGILSGSLPSARSRPASNQLLTAPPSPISPLSRPSYFGATSTQEPYLISPPSRPQSVLAPGVAEPSPQVLRQVRTIGSVSTAQDVEGQRRLESRPEAHWWQKPRWKGLRSRILMVLISAVLELILLSIYLGLVLAHELRVNEQFNVLFIMLILAATVFVCHSLIRLCIDAMSPSRRRRRNRSEGSFSRIPSVVGPSGYANPERPIRINTEAQLSEGSLKEPPPVYGLWRCSVRVNPDQFYWVRRTSMAGISEVSERSGHRRQGSSGTARPPSYMSDDGVSYAVEAAPRSTVPEPPLPPHPSEARRLL